MSYQLDPPDGEYPPLTELVARLQAEFPYVRTDSDRALDRARETAVWLENASPAIFLGHHAKALETASRLRSIGAQDVLWVEFGQDSSIVLNFVLLPGERISFGFASSEDERRFLPLIERCARALGCTTVQF